MKIAINAVRVSNRSGGGLETYIINFINTFAKYVYTTPELNIKFDVYTLYPKHFPNVLPQNIKQIKSPFLKTRSNYRQKQIDTGKNEVKNQKLKHLFSVSYLPDTIRHVLLTTYYFFGDYFRIFWTQIILPFKLINQKYDLVFSPTQLDALFFSPIEQIVVVHDTIPILFPEYKHKQMFYIKHLLPNILQKVKKVIVISESTKKDVIKYFDINEEKISVIPYGMKCLKNENLRDDVYNFKQKYGLGRFLLCVSNNLPHKNLPRLIEAFKIVVEKIKNIDLLIVGYKEKKYQSEIDKKIKDYGLENRIKILDHFKHLDLSVAYSGAELFVFPSLYEGFGLPPLEAMCFGCPVVVSNTSSLPEVCGDAAEYFNPIDANSIADSIIKVLNNDNLKKKLIEKGFEQVKEFSWEKSVEQLLKILT